MAQFFCRHCGERITLGNSGTVACPNLCADPFPKFPTCYEQELSENFMRSQFHCPCCGECDLDRRLIPALDWLQKLAGGKIEIILGQRCERFNGRARGVSKLAHLQGRAADIRIPGMTLQQMYDLAEQVLEFREGGIGVHDDGTLHVDVRVFKSRWGRVEGKYVGIESSKLLERW